MTLFINTLYLIDKQAKQIGFRKFYKENTNKFTLQALNIDKALKNVIEDETTESTYTNRSH